LALSAAKQNEKIWGENAYDEKQGEKKR